MDRLNGRNGQARSRVLKAIKLIGTLCVVFLVLLVIIFIIPYRYDFSIHSLVSLKTVRDSNGGRWKSYWCYIGNKTAIVLHGRYIEYYPNGKEKIITQYRQGMINGGFRCYHPNGCMKLSATVYTEGHKMLLNGDLTVWYADGTIMAKIQHDSKGLRTGTWLFFLNDATKVGEITYSDGRLVKMIKWLKNGKVYFEGEYANGQPLEIKSIGNDGTIYTIKAGSGIVISRNMDGTDMMREVYKNGQLNTVARCLPDGQSKQYDAPPPGVVWNGTSPKEYNLLEIISIDDFMDAIFTEFM